MNKFDIVVIDPPYRFSDALSMSATKRSAQANYDTMSLDDILSLPVENIVSDNAIIALWVPSSMLGGGMKLIQKYGFIQKQIYTWVKTTKSGKVAFNMGRQFRGATEHALIGAKGKPKPFSKSERNVDLSINLKHSQKPEHLQDKLEKMYPDANKLEMFARRDRTGWTCVGNECPSTLGITIEEWISANLLGDQ